MKDINFKDNIVKRNKIPVLIYTPEWIQLFNNFPSKALHKSVEKLEELLSEEKKCQTELNDIDKRKKLLLNKILYLSKEIHEDNNQAAMPKMEAAEKELLDINKRIPELIEQLEILPGMINAQNTELLKETIKRAYDLIGEHKDESQQCQDEVNELRKRLGELIQKKVDLEERINRLYSFVHGMVGAADMETLDAHFLKK